MKSMLTAQRKRNIPQNLLFKDYHLKNEICTSRLVFNEIHPILRVLCKSNVFNLPKQMVAVARIKAKNPNPKE